jgi:hypothetical protein
MSTFAQLLIYASYTLLNSDPSLEWALRERATKTADQIITFIKAKLERHSEMTRMVGQWTGFIA